MSVRLIQRNCLGVRLGLPSESLHQIARQLGISALPAPLLAYRCSDMRAPLLAGALSSGADPATFGRSSGADH